MSHKAWNYERTDSLLQGSSFLELPNTEKWRFTKLEASVNLRKVRNTHRPFTKSWHSLACPFSGLPHLVSYIVLRPPSLLWSPFAVCDVIHMQQSDWSTTVLALERKWNRPIDPTILSLRTQKNSLGTRLVTSCLWLTRLTHSYIDYGCKAHAQLHWLWV